MKKPLDRITEAYFGELGEQFADKVRNRIHWVCENAKGESILDVGCSQGITAILLGREGKSIIGIDLLEESIEYANNLLSSEEEITKKYVQFKAANFMEFANENQTFDCIIFGEILEHITDPKRFINMAAKMLNPGGSIIITLPFGINDYFDHKKTYYLSELLKFQSENLVVDELKFFGKWIGAIIKAKDLKQNTLSVDDHLLTRLEDAFFTVEKDLWQTIRDRGQKIKTLQEKVKAAATEKEKYTTDLKKKNQEITNNKEEIRKKDFELEKKDQNLSEKKEELARKDRELTEKIEELVKKDFEIDKKNVEIDKKNEEIDQLVKERLVLSESLTNNSRELEMIEECNKEVENLNWQLTTKENELQKAKTQLTTKENELQKAKTQLAAKVKEMKEIQDREKKLKKYITELEKQATIYKKEKIKVQEDLLESYGKEEKLLKTHSNLMKRYKALSESKLGSLTLSYWRKRRNVFGGK
ncbi:methyltransferase domain-containing protein [Neobacillus sp. PS2-9]|uniref:methyltransferase domain-containing protein n=1 Tax=Neobacillus sp. PS2-9 TaxID=3070676 RepID=UPI0027E1A20D|nr:methyltransferase domain-containing protein [Neobacillus sp. PS2-9]WML58598.1 methyltransferase domain-containing protein [Neobacillus sp. PS2-9]